MKFINLSLIVLTVAFSSLISGCAVVKIQSKTSEIQPYLLSHGSGDEILLTKPAKVNFYLWGILPPKRTIYIEDYFQGEGLKQGSSVEVTLRRSFASYFFSIVTLGVFYPVDIEFSLYAKKADSSVMQFEHEILDGKEEHP